MDNILEIENLRKEYKGFVLDNISFSLPRGYIMGFIGPNGAGKTTTIKLLLNLVRRNNGTIKIFGKELLLHEKEIKEKIGFVHDENHYFEELNAREISFLMRRCYQQWDNSSFISTLAQFGLPDKKKIKDYSKGMKTKFSLAVALSHHADLIVMDEPTSGLDPVFRNEILEVLSDVITDENKSILFSSHITSDLEKVADYITFINKGQIVFSENKDDILNRYAVVKGANADLNPEIEKELLGLRRTAYGFEALCSDSEAFQSKFLHKFIVEKSNLDQILIFFNRENRSVN